MARYETYAAWVRIIETGNRFHFIDAPIKQTTAFLRDAFMGCDAFIASDPVLSRLNPRKIQYRKLAICLAGEGCADTLDILCN